MGMTQQNLRSILAEIYSVEDEDPVTNIIVPKQGNWWNPQDYIPNPDKPTTWIAFLMRDGTPRSTPIYIQADQSEEVTSPISMVPNVSWVELQFVGDKAEELAQSLQHWSRMSKVVGLFMAEGAQLMAQDLGKYTVSNFYQDGLNSVLAYNAVFGLQWGNNLASEQDQLLFANMGGTVEEAS